MKDHTVIKLLLIVFLTLLMFTACEKPEEESPTDDCNCGIIVDGDNRREFKIQNYCTLEYRFINIKKDIELNNNKDYAPSKKIRCFDEVW